MSRASLRNSILLTIFLLLCLGAPALKAQEDGYMTHIVKWYEDMGMIAEKYGISAEVIMAYNGLKEPKVERKQVLRIPLRPENVDLEAWYASLNPQASAQRDTLEEEHASLEIMPSTPLETAPSKTNIALVLPFSSSERTRGFYYNFYCGSLLAASEMASRGLSVDLEVFDSGEELSKDDIRVLSACPLVIGPVYREEMSSLMSKVRSDETYFISPLDSRTTSLADSSSRFIQASGNTDAQNEDVIAWLKEETHPEDKVFLFTESGVKPSALAGMLESSGLEFLSVEYGILQGREMTDTLLAQMTPDGTNRIIIASEREAFVNDAVRNLNLLLHAKMNVVLYSAAKIRNFETIDSESLHNLQLRVSNSYYIDYDNPKVQKFLMKYRALYGAEPDPWAFQGYDMVECFASLIKDGVWPAGLSDSVMKGLQSDIELVKRGEGYVARGVRRVIYDPDFSIRLLR